MGSVVLSKCTALSPRKLLGSIFSCGLIDIWCLSEIFTAPTHCPCYSRADTHVRRKKGTCHQMQKCGSLMHF